MEATDCQKQDFYELRLGFDVNWGVLNIVSGWVGNLNKETIEKAQCLVKIHPLILHWEGFVLALPSSWNLNKQPLNVCCHCRSSFNQTSDDTLSVLVCFLSLCCCAVTLVTLPVPAALSGACGCSLFSGSCIHFLHTSVYEILESSSVTWTVCTCFESNWTSLPFHGFVFFFWLGCLWLLSSYHIRFGFCSDIGLHTIIFTF